MAWSIGGKNEAKDEKEKGVSTIGEEYINKAVGHVINATTHRPDDLHIRNKIAACMKQAIRMSTTKGGDIIEPGKTIIYRFATLLDGCKSYEELESKCLKAFNHRSDCKADKLIGKFHYLDWKMNFDVPIFEKKLPKQKGNSEDLHPEGLTPEQQQQPQVEEGLLEQQEAKADEVLAMAVLRLEALERTVEKLTKLTTELTQQLRKHSHLDGKVVVITEV